MGRGAKQTAKADILSAARKLIIQEGSTGTSMRDIAAELNISVGNLTYYYKTKIELMEDVVQELYAGETQNPVPENLHGLDQIFKRAEQKHSERLYYFRNYASFAASSEKISSIQKEFWLKNKERWKEILNNLCKAELINAEEYGGQFAAFTDSLAFMILYRNSRDEADNAMGLSAPKLSESMWSVFFPLLTPKGKQIYLNEIKNK